MNPNSYYKINGKKYPVFKTPLEKKVLNDLILNDIGVFILNDNGKLKAYNTQSNLPKQFNLFDKLPSLTTTAILKIGLVSVLGIWVYRLGRFTPNLNPFKVDKDYVERMRKKYKDLNSLKYKGTRKSGTGEMKSNAEGETSATLPNGWTIETPTRN